MDTKEAVSILTKMSMDNNLKINERAAINEALMAFSHIEYNNSEQVDFQGWPIKEVTMKQLRKFVRNNGALDDDVKLLVLQDDGMGYGANNGYCSDINVYDDGTKKEVQIWF